MPAINYRRVAETVTRVAVNQKTHFTELDIKVYE
jgi:hypothetical protein